MKRTLLFLLVLGALNMHLDAQFSDTINEKPKDEQIQEIGVNLDIALAVFARFPELFQEGHDGVDYFYFDISCKWGKPYRLLWTDINYSSDYYEREFGSGYLFNEPYTIKYPPPHLEPYVNDSSVLMEWGNAYGDRFGASFGLEWRSNNKLTFTHGPSVHAGLIFAKRIMNIYTQSLNDPHIFPIFSHSIDYYYYQTLILNYQLAYNIGALLSFSDHIHMHAGLRIGYTGYFGDNIVKKSYRLEKQAVSKSDPYPFILRTDISLVYRF